MLQNNKLPKDWKWIKLGSAAKFIDYRGKTPKKTDSGIPLITAKNVKMGFINDDPREYIAENDYQNWMTRGIPNLGDILFTTEAPMGNVAQIKTTTRIALAQRMITFQTYDIMVNSFLKYNLMSPQFQEILNSKGTGTTVKGIKASVLKQIEIPLPPLGAQQLIVSKIEELFSELDKGIEDLKTAQQQLKIYRQSVLKWAFEGKRKALIGELFDFVGGGTPSKQVPNYWIGDIPWASVKDVKGNYLNNTVDRISEDGLKNSSANIANKDEVILITRISPGKTIITNIKTAINQDLKVIKPKFNTTSKYIFYVFQAIERQCIKKSSGTTVLGINLTNLKEIEVPNLEIEEQNKTVQEIESRLSVADKMEESIAQSLQQAEALRQSILKKAFSGELI